MENTKEEVIATGDVVRTVRIMGMAVDEKTGFFEITRQVTLTVGDQPLTKAPMTEKHRGKLEESPEMQTIIETLKTIGA